MYGTCLIQPLSYSRSTGCSYTQVAIDSVNLTAVLEICSGSHLLPGVTMDKMSRVLVVLANSHFEKCKERPDGDLAKHLELKVLG